MESKSRANINFVCNQYDRNDAIGAELYIYASKADKLVLETKGKNMFSTDKLSEISNKIKDIVKDSPIGDAEKNIHALLKGMLTKMELVSREEFDVQAEVLRNTREKLNQLEAKLAELESLQKHQQ